MNRQLQIIRCEGVSHEMIPATNMRELDSKNSWCKDCGMKANINEYI